MRNPLQEQLLKAGLVKKSAVAQAVREQAKRRQGKGKPAAGDEPQVDAQRLQAERAERDRALAAERNALARANELRAQARQIVEKQRIERRGEIEYRFVDGNVIRSILVDATQRTQLASGALAIARHGEGFELVPRAAADKIAERDPATLVLDHGRTGGATVESSEEDAYYSRFKVPDDLIW